ncbi:MAG: hypothetical protein CL797_12230 [Chromatiales bacterium]|jgi:hypothetical protein|nr:hypothetical protein [Chromatiales bacterium]
MALNTLESKVRYRISRSKSSVFTPQDFLDLSGRPQIGRVLAKLVGEEALVKLGYGLYAKSRRSSLTGAVVPVKGIPELAREALMKIGVEVRPSAAEQAYNRGQSLQVPTGRVIGVKGRVSRKIGFGGNNVMIENAA